MTELQRISAWMESLLRLRSVLRSSGRIPLAFVTRRTLIILLTTAFFPIAGCKLGGYAETRATRVADLEKKKLDPQTLGASRFLFDDLGGLNTDTLQTNASPWKVVVTAMTMEYAKRNKIAPSAELIPRIFQQYGWITHDWRGQLAKRSVANFR